MDLIDIASLFQNEEGVNSLLHGGDVFGIFLGDESGRAITNNTIDVGLLERESLEYNVEIPLGYESYLDSTMRRIIRCTCTLQHNDIVGASTKAIHLNPTKPYILVKCDYYPSNSTSDSSKPFYDANFDTLTENPNLKTLTLPPGALERFQITISLDDRFEGSIARWIVLTFKGYESPLPTSITETTFLMAIQVKGCIISAVSRKALSSDAPAFVPTYLTTYFDSMIPVSNTLQLPEPKKKQLAFTPPSIFQAIITSMKDYGIPSPFLIQSYIDFSSSNSITSFVKLHLHLSSTPPGPLKSGIDHINTLLALNCAEELQMTKDIIQYDLHYQKIWFMPLDHTLKGHSEGVVKATFLVKGLSESRPKLSIGDIIRLRPAEEDIVSLCNKDHIGRHLSELQGIITSCSLKTEEVECQFLITRQTLREANDVNGSKTPMAQIIYECNKIRYHMRFSFKREGFAFISESLNTILKDDSFIEVLSPDLDIEPRANLRFDFDPPGLVKVEFKSESDNGFEWNAEQLFAIEAISCNLWKAVNYLSSTQVPKRIYTAGPIQDMKRRQRLPPFIIHGPPGTGKTSTVIEAIRRLKEIHPTKRLLVCAPSDAAADVLCSRLRKYFTNKQMLRLNWWQRLIDSVQPPDMINYCMIDSRGLFDMPARTTAARLSATKQKVLSYDIIVTTCVCAGALRLYNDNSGTLLFDVVVVDEVSQATEGEVLVPLSMCSQSGIMVLAGDPKQLGAEMRSPLYRIPEYSLSLQERLMALPLYTRCQPLNIKIDMISPRSIPIGTPRELALSPRDNLSVLSSRDPPLSPASSLLNPRIESGLSSRLSSDIGMSVPPVGPIGPRSLSLNLYGLTGSSQASPRSVSGSSSTFSSGRSIFNFDIKSISGITDSGESSTSGGFDLASSLGVFLKKNYRSHHHMLQVPSKLFYHGLVEAYADTSRVAQYLNWSWLPSFRTFPMLFIGVNGQHYHALDSPSFYNLNEAVKVVEVVKSLLAETNLGIDMKSIGVIGGFRSQVLKIRQLLRSEGLSAINVGGVEDYQGQEKDVIIISTVLTSRVPTYERHGALGLLGDDRRFNVAVTRGVGLCIVIGHPIHLYSDPNWREFMEYCDQYGCCAGYPCPLLSRYVRDRRDDDDLLNIAAQAALGGGYDDQAMVDMSYNFSNGRDSYWRVNL